MIPKTAKLAGVKANETATEKPTMKIAEGIAKLKTDAKWPKEKIVPAFYSQLGSIYLSIESKSDIVPTSKTKNYNVVTLPHPLSSKRSVCYIGSNLDSDEEKNNMVQRFKDLGILGKIKIVQDSVVEQVLDENNHSSLQNLAQNHDTFLVEAKCKSFLKKLRGILEEEGKFATAIHELSDSFLCLTAVWVNFNTRDGLSATVGHTGHTDQELQENVEKVIQSLRSNSFFTNGLGDIKLIQIMTGATEGITIYQDDSPAKPPLVLHERAVARVFTTLREQGKWPVNLIAPLTDKDSVYVNVFSKNFTTFENKLYGMLHMQTPLNLGRRVCFIGSDVDTEIKQTLMANTFREQGVVGKIKIIPCSTVESFLKSDDQSSLQELAESHDMYLVDGGCKFLISKLHKVLAKERKFSALLSGGWMNVTAVWANYANDGLLIKVGDTSIDAGKLQKNIMKAVNTLPYMLFPNELGDIKSIRVKVGDNDEALVYKDASDVEIFRGIKTLKGNMGYWPKKTKFNDKSTTVVLKLVPHEVIRSRHTSLEITMPHPLSLDRSVCYITTRNLTNKYESQLIQRYRDAGVKGNIEVISHEEVERLSNERDLDALCELARSYDSHFVDSNADVSRWARVHYALGKECKLLGRASRSNLGLCYTGMWLNMSSTAYEVKVGHCGLTDEQLHENIKFVVNYVNHSGWTIFHNGFANIKSLELVTGNKQGVVLYQDDSRAEMPTPETAPEATNRAEQADQGSAKKKKSRKRKAAPPESDLETTTVANKKRKSKSLDYKSEKLKANEPA